MSPAYEVANDDLDVLTIERDWEALADDIDQISEPWCQCGTQVETSALLLTRFAPHPKSVWTSASSALGAFSREH